MPTVWVYNPGGEYLIVKRTPFSYQVVYMDGTGREQVEIKQGVGIPLPVWETICKVGAQTFARFAGNIYDISDLAVGGMIPSGITLPSSPM